MKQLKKAAHEASASQSDKEKIESLGKAFQLFTQETSRLENAYHTLNEQFQNLSLEFQDANHTLQNKVAELDIITNYLHSILNHIAQGILFIDSTGVVTTYNLAAETILGIPTEQVLMHSFWHNFKDDLFGFSMRESLQKEEAFTSSCIDYKTPNTIHCDLEIMTTFVSKKNPKAIKRDSPPPTQGMIVMIRDVTVVHHLQIVANRTDKMKDLGEMAAHVAHEIRNPLGGIKGFASLLKRDLKNQPNLEQMADQIIEGTDNLNRLVNQILHYTRPVHPHFERTDLIALLHETKTHLLADSTINQNKIDISIESPFHELFIPIDSQLIKSALLNLLVNAIQAMPQGGTVSLVVQQKHDQAVLIISDTGMGIPEEYLSKIYSPFFTTKPEGNGLGLAEVQKVVQAHGGTIDVHSTLGRGTTFTIKIPLKQRQT